MTRKAAAKSALQVVDVAVETLIPYARNARTHSDDQVAQIAASIREFGWTNPVLIDGDRGIVAGHGRVLAARKLGQAQVPCIELAGLTEAKKRAYVIADNKLALNAGWDDALLRLEVGDLLSAEFDASLLGFDPDELEALGGPAADSKPQASKSASFNYQEQFAVLIGCTDEAHQTEVFEKLQALGYDCKVLVN